MPASSNFQEAIREAQSSALVGPNVVNKALPYVGGGMVLTAGGVLGGLTLLSSNPAGFMPLFWVALIGNFILFFVAQNVANKGDNATALPLMAARWPGSERGGGVRSAEHVARLRANLAAARAKKSSAKALVSKGI